MEKLKDCEIIIFRGFNNREWKLIANNEYCEYNNTFVFSLDRMIDFLKEGNVYIESVKRLSDGVVFSIGNGMNYKGENNIWNEYKRKFCRINKFILRDDNIYINNHITDKNIEDWVLCVLLITEDGVRILNIREPLYILNTVTFKTIELLFGNTSFDIPNSKYFSTSKARLEYISLNKPELSNLLKKIF